MGKDGSARYRPTIDRDYTNIIGLLNGWSQEVLDTVAYLNNGIPKNLAFPKLVNSSFHE